MHVARVALSFITSAIILTGAASAQDSTASLFIVDRTDGKIASLGAGGLSSTFAYDESGIFKIESNSRANIAQGIFGTGATTRFSIDGAGRVGIGTTSPWGVLDILGGAAYDGSGDPFALAFQWAGGGYRHWVRTRHNSSGVTGNAIDFFVNNSTTPGASAAPGTGSLHTMPLNGGRVGIGTQSPSFKLHVVESGLVGMRVESTTAGGVLASFGGNGDFKIDGPAISGGRLMVKENGNVGIGKNNPTQKLDVVGNAVVSGTLAGGSLLITNAIAAGGNVSAASFQTTGSVTANSIVFPDGTTQATAVGNAFSSLRTSVLQLPPNGAAEASFGHLDLPGGNFQITATFTLENLANIAFQNNARQVACSLNGEGYEETLAAPALNGKTSNTLTLHSFRVSAFASSVVLACRAVSGGTDRSYVYITTRRLTATRINDFTAQP